MRSSHVVLALSLVATTAAAGPKPDAKKEAKVHIDNATKAHAAGKFDVALAELRAAYKLDPQPDLLYAMGQVYSKLGRCTDATESYEKFRTAKKDDPAIAKVVDEAIAACKPTDSPLQDAHPNEGASEPPKGDTTTTTSTPPPTTTTTTARRPSRRRRPRRSSRSPRRRRHHRRARTRARGTRTSSVTRWSPAVWSRSSRLGSSTRARARRSTTPRTRRRSTATTSSSTTHTASATCR
jgi:hypothetical protein